MKKTLVVLASLTIFSGGVRADNHESLVVETVDTPLKAPYSPALERKLRAALASKGPNYRPRTEHLLPSGEPEFTNRLILQDSPYLLQHAHNPVDWHAWGDEVFARAKRENKVIFLSIGYSTCHWCHVMERESFEDKAIARILNTHFIPVKVDRERRPDVDASYMAGMTLLTGHGGWPLSAFLTPDGNLFSGGTYFPRDVFAEILSRVSDLWQRNPALLVAESARVAEAVASAMANQGTVKQVSNRAIVTAVNAIVERHDTLQGGFSEAPKFPNEPLLFLLLEHTLRTGDVRALEAAEHTLQAMARGGMYDQVGGGFHRYSTDPDWLVPHFEKMLYNQANLGRLYLEAYRLTGRALYARIARQTLDYVLRDMSSPKGAFYSATDADSEGQEGAFFLWTPDELEVVLGEQDAALAIELYGASDSGNFEGRNILHLPLGIEAYAKQHEFDVTTLLARIDDIRGRLRTARAKREPPLRDDKIITAWNGMMISAFASAAMLLDDTRYREAALHAAQFVWHANHRGNGYLWRVHLHGRSSVPAVQEDYAYLAEAFVTLYDLEHDSVWLQRAELIVSAMNDAFWDSEAGGFFMNGAETTGSLMVRPKDHYDGAIPAGNSVAVRALTRLARRTGKEDYLDRANSTLAAYASSIQDNPPAYAYMLVAADETLHGELGETQYAARGAVTVRVKPLAIAAGRARLRLSIEMQPSWHINAAQPLQKYLIPTAVTLSDASTGWHLHDVVYPEPEIVQLGFQRQKLALYQGRLELLLELSRADAANVPLIPVQLKLQACNDEVCLPPEELSLKVNLL